MVSRIAVIGAGSWGTAVAALVSRNAPTIIWARRKELAEEISTLGTPLNRLVTRS